MKPSGNLDTLLPSEASQVLLVQQRTVRLWVGTCWVVHAQQQPQNW